MNVVLNKREGSMVKRFCISGVGMAGVHVC